MRVEITGRHLTVTAAMRDAAREHIARIERMLTQAALSAQVVITREKVRLRVELNLHAKGEHFLHAEATGRDWETALASAADKLEHQAHTLKSRWTEGKRRGLSAGKAASAAPPARARRASGRARPVDEDAEREVLVVRVPRQRVKAMSIEEATLLMSDGRNSVVVFRSGAGGAVSMLYRLPDGNLGLIEPEA